MPDHIFNKIIFDKRYGRKIFRELCPGGQIDFNLLIERPLYVYRGDLTAIEKDDFPCNWNTWNREFWGTKWNAYNGSIGFENRLAFIKFCTAWTIPRPVIAAFANKFRIPFTFKYYDEGEFHSGIEEWATDPRNPSEKIVVRISKNENDPDLVEKLKTELYGYKDIE